MKRWLVVFGRGLFALVLLLSGKVSLADAGGPDYWKVRDVDKNDVLNMRSSADYKAPKTGEIPYDARCITNMGCKGGLTFEEFTSLSGTQKQQILKQRPRWCRVRYQGITGWVAGRYLAEGDCPDDERKHGTSKTQGVDPLNHSYLIEKDRVALRGGYAREMIPGTTAVIISELIHRPVYADLDGDGVDEAVSIVLQHTGGTGSFYYLVAADKVQLIESYFLGDRIYIVSIKIARGIITVQYLDRHPAQPMATGLSVRSGKDFKLIDNRLVLSNPAGFK